MLGAVALSKAIDNGPKRCHAHALSRSLAHPQRNRYMEDVLQPCPSRLLCITVGCTANALEDFSTTARRRMKILMGFSGDAYRVQPRSLQIWYTSPACRGLRARSWPSIAKPPTQIHLIWLLCIYICNARTIVCMDRTLNAHRPHVYESR